MNQVELAVRFGKTLRIFDVDGLEPMLYRLARKDLQNAGPRKIVALGDKQLDFNENFRMLPSRAIRAPTCHRRGRSSARSTSPSRSGLEGQLLGIRPARAARARVEEVEMLKQEEED